MEFNKIFKAGLLASTSALALAALPNSADAQPTNWNGFYAGAGFGWESNSGKVRQTPQSDGSQPDFDWNNRLSSSGIVGNIFGGYRMMVSGPWFLGGEARFTFGGASGNACGSVNNGGSGPKQVDCGATHVAVNNKFGLGLALTAGMQMSNGMMPWVKVGYAGKTVKVVGSVSSVGTSVNSTKWLSGIEFGAGVDMPIGVIGGSINMPAFLRLDMSYTVFGSAKYRRDSNTVGSCGGPCKDGHLNYGPNTFQAGAAFAVKF